MKNQLNRNIASGSLLSLVNIATVFLTYPIYLYYLGYESYGLWLILGTLLSFSRLSDLGITSAVTKLIAEHHGTEDYRLARQTLVTACGIVLAASLLPLTLLLLCADPILGSFNLSPDRLQSAKALLPWIGALCGYGLFTEVLLGAVAGFGRMDLSNTIQVAGRSAGHILAILLLTLGWNIAACLAGSILCHFIWHIFAVRQITAHFSLHWFHRDSWSSERAAHLVRFGRPLLAGSLVGLCFVPLSKWILARYAGVAAVPIYDLALRGSMQVRGLVETGLKALTPEISRLYRSEDPGSTQAAVALNRKGLRIVFLIATPLYGIAYLLAEPILQTWLGIRYDPAIPPAMQLALIGTYISLLGVPAYYLAMGIGRVGVCFRERLINTLGNMIAIGACLSHYGSIDPVAISACLIFGYSLSFCFMLITASDLFFSQKQTSWLE